MTTPPSILYRFLNIRSDPQYSQFKTSQEDTILPAAVSENVQRAVSDWVVRVRLNQL